MTDLPEEPGVRDSTDDSTEGSAEEAGPRCLVTGAHRLHRRQTGARAARLGSPVRALARTPQKLRDYPWADRVEVVRGDVTDADSLTEAMRDVDVAYYLVHALGSGSDFEETDRRAARNFGEKARAAGVRRIVYLGGLTPAGVPERSCRRICARAPRSGGSCSTPGCRRRCCGRRW